MRKILIDCYLAELDENVGADNGLKSQQWNSLTANFAVDHGVPLSKSQLQNQLADLKKKWGAYSDLLKQSGFGWNASTSTRVALFGNTTVTTHITNAMSLVKLAETLHASKLTKFVSWT